MGHVARTDAKTNLHAYKIMAGISEGKKLLGIAGPILLCSTNRMGFGLASWYQIRTVAGYLNMYYESNKENC